MKASVIDDVVREFAPPVEPGPSGRTYSLGDENLDVSKFFVAWNPGQLEGIIRRTQDTSGAREKSKREAWGLKTFLPSRAGKEGVNT